jgi:hypothetical protein
VDLKELESGVDPHTHWYYQSKKIPLLEYVDLIYKKINQQLTIVDVGSGSSFFMEELYKYSPEKIKKIYCVDIGYSEQEEMDTKGKTIERLRQLPDKIENGIVVMMDVLEHVEDDVALLAEIKKRCVNTNYFFITVPAFLDLWSQHDVYLGHYRRYTIKTLTGSLQKAKYSANKIHYMYGSIFPLVWIARKFSKSSENPKSDMAPTSSFVNSILKSWTSFGIQFRKFNQTAGVTCAAEGEI